jgi:hypothetical protein
MRPIRWSKTMSPSRNRRPSRRRASPSQCVATRC